MMQDFMRELQIALPNFCYGLHRARIRWNLFWLSSSRRKAMEFAGIAWYRRENPIIDERKCWRTLCQYSRFDDGIDSLMSEPKMVLFPLWGWYYWIQLTILSLRRFVEAEINGFRRFVLGCPPYSWRVSLRFQWWAVVKAKVRQSISQHLSSTKALLTYLLDWKTPK